MHLSEGHHAAQGGPSIGRRAAVVVALLIIFAASALSGCGGGERQDENAIEGTFKVQVLSWRFPSTQPLGKTQRFILTVRNTDTRAIPQLILTIGGLKQFTNQEGAANDVRPIWIPNETTWGNATPNNSSLSTSYNLGVLRAGQLHRYVLPLTPVRQGRHQVSYSLAGNLVGTAKLQVENGDPAADTRVIAIDPTPVFNEKIFD